MYFKKQDEGVKFNIGGLALYIVKKEYCRVVGLHPYDVSD